MQHKPSGRWLAVGLLAASALAVSTVVAVGQQSSPPSDPSASASSADAMSSSTPDSSMADPSSAPADSSMAASQPGADGVTHVTNGPVPDTPASRANNGAPMSNAGQHTAPAGN